MAAKQAILTAFHRFWEGLGQSGGETERSDGARKPVSTRTDGSRYLVITLATGVVALVIGIALVYGARHSNSGSPVGWMFLAIGVFGVLAAMGLAGDGYE